MISAIMITDGHYFTYDNISFFVSFPFGFNSDRVARGYGEAVCSAIRLLDHNSIQHGKALENGKRIQPGLRSCMGYIYIYRLPGGIPVFFVLGQQT